MGGRIEGRDRDRDWDRGSRGATSSFRPEWRNLLAEWGWWLGAPNGAVGFGIVGACGAGLSVSVPASVPADNESNGMLFPMTPSSAPAPDGAAGTGIEDRGAVETAFCKWKILNGEV